jgi:2-polyprenyl-3-methyl-5-hydroxy-6-metoxy-1,4-benzoquinol methylase
MFSYSLFILSCCVFYTLVDAGHQWIYQPAYGWDRQWKQGVWHYMDKVPAERGRIAMIGDILIRMYASPNASVLDVGSAEGALTDFLTPGQRERYLGVDISKVVVAHASKIRAPMKFVHSVAHEFTTDQKWDVIVLSEILMHVEHEKILRQYEKYLAPNGIMIISVFFLEKDGANTYSNIFTFSRQHFTVVDRMEVKGFTTTAREDQGARDWLTSRIDVYRSKQNHQLN